MPGMSKNEQKKNKTNGGVPRSSPLWLPYEAARSSPVLARSSPLWVPYEAARSAPVWVPYEAARSATPAYNNANVRWVPYVHNNTNGAVLWVPYASKPQSSTNAARSSNSNAKKKGQNSPRRIVAAEGETKEATLKSIISKKPQARSLAVSGKDRRKEIIAILAQNSVPDVQKLKQIVLLSGVPVSSERSLKRLVNQAFMTMNVHERNLIKPMRNAIYRNIGRKINVIIDQKGLSKFEKVKRIHDLVVNIDVSMSENGRRRNRHYKAALKQILQAGSTGHPELQPVLARVVEYFTPEKRKEKEFWE